MYGSLPRLGAGGIQGFLHPAWRQWPSIADGYIRQRTASLSIHPQASKSQHHAMDVSSPGSSLAEWSQKIKDLQQQVDRDGLQEQERLEAEIARSRMERARRRSTLTGNARIDQGELPVIAPMRRNVD